MLQCCIPNPSLELCCSTMVWQHNCSHVKIVSYNIFSSNFSSCCLFQFLFLFYCVPLDLYSSSIPSVQFLFQSMEISLSRTTVTAIIQLSDYTINAINIIGTQSMTLKTKIKDHSNWSVFCLCPSTMSRDSSLWPVTTIPTLFMHMKTSSN